MIGWWKQCLHWMALSLGGRLKQSAMLHQRMCNTLRAIQTALGLLTVLCFSWSTHPMSTPSATFRAKQITAWMAKLFVIIGAESCTIRWVLVFKNSCRKELTILLKRAGRDTGLCSWQACVFLHEYFLGPPRFLRHQRVLAWGSAYGVSFTFIVSPYRHPAALEPDNAQFNFRLSSQRIAIEHYIGIMKARFPFWGNVQYICWARTISSEFASVSGRALPYTMYALRFAVKQFDPVANQHLMMIGFVKLMIPIATFRRMIYESGFKPSLVNTSKKQTSH